MPRTDAGDEQSEALGFEPHPSWKKRNLNKLQPFGVILSYNLQFWAKFFYKPGKSPIVTDKNPHNSQNYTSIFPTTHNNTTAQWHNENVVKIVSTLAQ